MIVNGDLEARWFINWWLWTVTWKQGGLCVDDCERWLGSKVGYVLMTVNVDLESRWFINWCLWTVSWQQGGLCVDDSERWLESKVGYVLMIVHADLEARWVMCWWLWTVTSKQDGLYADDCERWLGTKVGYVLWLWTVTWKQSGLCVDDCERWLGSKVGYAFAAPHPSHMSASSTGGNATDFHLEGNWFECRSSWLTFFTLFLTTSRQTPGSPFFGIRNSVFRHLVRISFDWDRSVARPLPTQMGPIHKWTEWIWTHNPSFRAEENITSFVPLELLEHLQYFSL
jgi:hypothetical protein